MLRGHDLTGLRFGLVVVLQRAEDTWDERPQWLVRCDCGVERVIRGCQLKQNPPRSHLRCLSPRPSGGRRIGESRVALEPTPSDPRTIALVDVRKRWTASTVDEFVRWLNAEIEKGVSP
jgi:hypothetical protein